MKENLQELIKDAWLGVDFSQHAISKPLDLIKHENADEVYQRLIWLMSRPEYLSFAVKILMNIDLLPFQAVILAELWQRKFPMFIGNRGCGKSFLLSIYAILRAVFLPGRKIVIVGSAFRQSKILFDYMEGIWNGSPVLQSICYKSGPRRDPDMCKLMINLSRITCLPIGDGQKIRGQRAQDIISDEFASIPIDIFENVIAGFASVSAAPADNVRAIASRKRAQELGLPISASQSVVTKSNQIILSGTAYYDFNHFSSYWKKWKAIINSGGEIGKLKEVFNGEVPKDFHYDDYSVIRMPWTVLPEGFMDEGQISRSKATIHSGIYSMEFLSIFSKDSMGFYKRSLLERCTPKYNQPLVLEDGEQVLFEPSLIGDHGIQHVLACDPASEVDNFSITVLAIHPTHRRIKYVWTTTRKIFGELKQAGQIDEDDFYGFCARKIRDLMKVFPNVVQIGIDGQGGGIAVYEALHDRKKLKAGELPLWNVIDPNKPLDTDGNSGLHIVEIVQFANSVWLSEANHGMRFDFENRKLIFPAFDPISLGLSEEEDAICNRKYDTLSDVVHEIEELKNELSIIEITQTPNGRDHWDTPKIKIGIGKVGRLRKDRYSSLLIANMIGRNLDKNKTLQYESYGGFSKTFSEKPSGDFFQGPQWFTSKMNNVYG